MTDAESRATPTTFSHPDTAHIREMIETPGALLLCPSCGTTLERNEPLASGPGVVVVWEVTCASCHRIAIIRDLPE